MEISKKSCFFIARRTILRHPPLTNTIYTRIYVIKTMPILNQFYSNLHTKEPVLNAYKREIHSVEI